MHSKPNSTTSRSGNLTCTERGIPKQIPHDRAPPPIHAPSRFHAGGHALLPELGSHVWCMRPAISIRRGFEASLSPRFCGSQQFHDTRTGATVDLNNACSRPLACLRGLLRPPTSLRKPHLLCRCRCRVLHHLSRPRFHLVGLANAFALVHADVSLRHLPDCIIYQMFLFIQRVPTVCLTDVHTFTTVWHCPLTCERTSLCRWLLPCRLIDPHWQLIPVCIAAFFFSHPDAASSAHHHRAYISLAFILTWAARLFHNYVRREGWQFGRQEDWRYADLRRKHGRFWIVSQFFAVSLAQHGMLVGLTMPFQVSW